MCEMREEEKREIIDRERGGKKERKKQLGENERNETEGERKINLKE
jgi:hypothetical protein